MRILRIPLLAVLLSIVSPCVLAQSVSRVDRAVAPMTAQEKAAMADRIRAEALHAWEGYKKYAWGHDELHPLSKSPFDWYGNPLLMTPVDALDTLTLMGLKPQAD